MIGLVSLFKQASKSNSPTSIIPGTTIIAFLEGITVLFVCPDVLFSDWIRQMLFINYLIKLN